MHDLGHTRSAQRANHLLLTPDTFVRAPLPGMSKATAIVHAGPAVGARFTQFTVEFEEGGVLGATTAQRFIYVIEGEVRMGGQVNPEPLEGDASIEVRHLVPDNVAFDFAVNVMTYQPGAALPMVESHVMEHGLLMLSGGGIYRLGDCWYPVKAGDFIWMAPFCPQWFGALGKTPAKYLIYKDWNRHPLAAAL